MVDVEQRALCALEQNAFSLAPPRIEQQPHQIHERQHFGGQRRKIVVNILAVDRLEVETAAQRVMMRQQTLDLGPQRRQIGQVHEADSAAADLVLIGGTDAAFGRADARCRAVGLADGFELAVQRQDQGHILGDAQIVRRHGDALFLELGDLIEQRLQIDHNPVADDRKLAAAHDARRQQ